MKNLIKETNKKSLTIFDYIVAYTASAFSVLFALSIVLEIKNTVSGYLAIMLCLFLVFFLLFNESMKIKESRKQNPKIFNLLFSFLVTISLSTMGGYFWTNKSHETNKKLSEGKDISILNISQKYTFKIDSIKNIDFYQTNQYKELNNQIKFHKAKSILTIEERTERNNQISELFKQINTQKESFEQSKKDQIAELNNLKQSELSLSNTKINNDYKDLTKNNFISFIFVILIMITEFLIYYMNKEIGIKKAKMLELTKSKNFKDYRLYRSMIDFIFEIHSKGDKINIKTIGHSYFAQRNKLSPDTTKAIYDSFIIMGLLEKSIDIEERDYIIKFDKKTTLKKFDKCFEIIMES